MTIQKENFVLISRGRKCYVMSHWMIWLVIVILLGLVEAATVNLVSIWFIASGIITLFLSLFVSSFVIQFAVFVILGIIFLIVTRKKLLDYQTEEDAKLNLERVIGMEGIVTQKITKNEIGEVKVDGKLWSAVSNTSIKENEPVLIKEIDGVKLVVEKIKKEEPKKKAPTKKTTPKKKTTKSTSHKKASSKKESEK